MPQGFIALGFSQASIKILKTLSFLTSWIIQAVVHPVKFLRASLNFTVKNIFFKSILNTSEFYVIWITIPQSFIALGFSQASIKILKTLSFLTSLIIQAVVHPVQFLRASLNFTIKNIFFKSILNTNKFYVIWTTIPLSFIDLGFSQASIKILKTLSFLTSWIIQAVVHPVKFLKASLNFTIKNIFFKSSLNTSKFYVIWTTIPQSFIALGFSQVFKKS